MRVFFYTLAGQTGLGITGNSGRNFGNSRCIPGCICATLSLMSDASNMIRWLDVVERMGSHRMADIALYSYAVHAQCGGGFSEAEWDEIYSVHWNQRRALLGQLREPFTKFG